MPLATPTVLLGFLLPWTWGISSRVPLPLLAAPVQSAVTDFTAEACPREATPCPRSGAVAKRSYRTSEVRGSGRECQAAMAQECPRGATQRPRSGVAAERSNTMSKEWWLCGCWRAKRSYSTFKVRRGGCEELPLVQGI